MEEAGNDDFGYVWFSNMFFLLKRKKCVMWLMWVLRLICAQCLEYQLTFKFGMVFFNQTGDTEKPHLFLGALMTLIWHDMVMVDGEHIKN